MNPEGEKETGMVGRRQWLRWTGVSELEFSIDCDGELGVATGVVMEMSRNICEKENQGR